MIIFEFLSILRSFQQAYGKRMNFCHFWLFFGIYWQISAKARQHYQILLRGSLQMSVHGFIPQDLISKCTNALICLQTLPLYIFLCYKKKIFPSFYVHIFCNLKYRRDLWMILCCTFVKRALLTSSILKDSHNICRFFLHIRNQSPNFLKFLQIFFVNYKNCNFCY